MASTTLERAVMAVLAAGFLLVDLLFLFGRPLLDQLIGWWAGLLGVGNAGFDYSGFFLALTNAMMLSITYIAVQVARDPVANHHLLPVLVVSKLASSATGLALYLRTPAFGYLLIALVDFPIALVAWWVYGRLRRRAMVRMVSSL